MNKTVSFAAVLLVVLSIAILVPGGICRSLPNSSPELVSDGLHDDEESGFSRFNPIRFKGILMDSGEDTHTSNSSSCEQMYGFLPCSKTVPGYLFLILVYEYLLFHAESYVASGGEKIFKILGPGVFGASAFQIIGSLPEALILLASGLSSSNESAEEYVITGVGLLAGSSILLLTLIWGTCVILASQNFSTHLHSNLSDQSKKYNPIERFLVSLWPGCGIVTDLGTSRTSRIMLLSVIPLMMIQIPTIFNLSYAGQRVFVQITLAVSIVFLLFYFFYQFFHPWIQKRRLLYIKHEHLVVDILKHLQDQTMGNLLSDDGSPNVSIIRRLFEERDFDGDNVISSAELREFLQEIKTRNLQSDKENNIAEIMGEIDGDNDGKITMDEFVNVMTKWLDDTKDAMNKRYHSVKSLKDMYEILKPWIQKKREEREMMRNLIPVILEHLQNSVYGSLLAEDGTPDVPAIKRLFKDIDLDKDDTISYFELKELINNIKFGIIPHNVDVAAQKILEELDISGDQLINEAEFVSGLSKWLNTTYNQSPNSQESEGDTYHKMWEQADKLVEEKFIDNSPLAWTKAIALIVLGIVMLGVLAEPLIHSVREFSTAANLQSFYVAFILVPLATNARVAFSAINEARRKKLYTTSLTLSEIYGTVFMNNVLGLVVLLSLIYFRGLSWNFSAEILMVLAVSAFIGFLASFNTVFPVWTSLLAYLLYPMSLVLVYILGDFNWLS
ncbi:Calmodulin and related proteins (EF-Hand superfamily) [Handroanthus impetiginosus]|uniref:Calmodulin and related proteins (EF-Hand superfamily) n=1 Tax=Handroanthus impetiginosus TaxID=429701 RepID=A0A2G9HTV0_9LAMI|nr:Calmodulin and related proteins (EF-Hand superfamily) [Handroanthus impetiginosus]